jgi:hypothetical protein
MRSTRPGVCRVARAFAEVVVREYRAGDTIWVPDYQLMLLPALWRRAIATARIGFFGHIRFPSSELFRVLPCAANSPPRCRAPTSSGCPRFSWVIEVRLRGISDVGGRATRGPAPPRRAPATLSVA